MNFEVKCACGKVATVTEGSANAVIMCSCGKSIEVPSLRQLRQQAGLSAFAIAPELVLESMLTRGELPAERDCLLCGAQVASIRRFHVICERSWEKKTGDSRVASGLLAVLTTIFFGWWVYIRKQREVRQLGRDTQFTLPVRMCDHCAADVRDRQGMVRVLSEVPVYRQLLDKFPNAEISRQS